MVVNMLSISGIPNIFPAFYVDKMYFENRVQKYPESKFKLVETKEMYSTLDEPNLTGSQFIQNSFYPKYKATLYINENIDIDKVRFAQSVVFTLTNGIQINAKILDIKNSALSDTSIFKCEIDFFEKKYDTESVINYLTYPECLPNNWDNTQLHRLILTNDRNIDADTDFASGASITFYTKLNPIYSRSELEHKPDKNVGVDYIYRSSDFATVNCTFYLSQAELSNLKKYLPRCYYINTGVAYGTRFIDATTGLIYTAVEAIIPKISENNDLIKIYEFKLVLKSSQIDYNHFA